MSEKQDKVDRGPHTSRVGCQGTGWGGGGCRRVKNVLHNPKCTARAHPW